MKGDKKMRQVETTISGKKVNLITVEQGEKVGQVRRAAGLEIGQFSTIRIAEDCDGDLGWAFPETAAALKQAGVNLDSIVAVIEVK
jgi:hypothetical protein